jgi:hypothetical protein
MRKNYILDTNILLHNPESINKFEDKLRLYSSSGNRRA